MRSRSVRNKQNLYGYPLGTSLLTDDRTALEPVTILGHHIPAGTNIIFMNMLAGDRVTEENLPQIRALDAVRSESSNRIGLGERGLWTNPQAFAPERWIVDDGSGGQKFNAKAGVSVPFGVGVRSCAGKALAVSRLRVATKNSLISDGYHSNWKSRFLSPR